jgi:ferredoxin
MMASLVPALAAWGVARDDIRFESFGPATARLTTETSPAPAQPPGAAFEVRFQRSGRTLAWNGEDGSLLDVAERHGVAIESGCRSGSCGSCETRLVSGTVGYTQTPDHDIAPGHCLLCVGTPQSALVLDA